MIGDFLYFETVLVCFGDKKNVFVPVICHIGTVLK